MSAVLSPHYREGPAVHTLNQNTILLVDTGTGKACSLVVLRTMFTTEGLKAAQGYHMFVSLSMSLDHHTKLIFMVAISTVPNVLLVSQQAYFIQQTTYQVVGYYYWESIAMVSGTLIHYWPCYDWYASPIWLTNTGLTRVFNNVLSQAIGSL